MELAAFTAVFRTHRGSIPRSPRSSTPAPQRRPPRALRHVYKGLAAYRKRTVAEAAQRGYPVARHLFLHYPDDPNTHDLRYQYLLGRDMMVAPVLDKRRDTVERIFSRRATPGAICGPAQMSEAPAIGGKTGATGKPAVFLRKGAETAEAIVGGLKAAGVL